MTLVPLVVELLRAKGVTDIPVFVGGIIPDRDREALQRGGIARIYTPGQATLTEIVRDIAELVAARHASAAPSRDCDQPG
jgi:methylmalonyl-CoA mutase C-terminal domain/subunit